MLDVCLILGDCTGDSVQVGEKEAKGLESYKMSFNLLRGKRSSPAIKKHMVPKKVLPSMCGNVVD